MSCCAALRCIVLCVLFCYVVCAVCSLLLCCGALVLVFMLVLCCVVIVLCWDVYGDVVCCAVLSAAGLYVRKTRWYYLFKVIIFKVITRHKT